MHHWTCELNSGIVQTKAVSIGRLHESFALHPVLLKPAGTQGAQDRGAQGSHGAQITHESQGALVAQLGTHGAH